MRTTMRTTVLCLLGLNSAVSVRGATYVAETRPTDSVTNHAEVSSRRNPLFASERSMDGVIHLPLQRRSERKRRNRKREAVSGAIGLGDTRDITYNVLVQLGDISTPLVLDTGSSDTWVVSTSCKECIDMYSARSPDTKPPFYPEEELHPAGKDVQIFYGDSRTGTHAFGVIGYDTSGVAGIMLENQYFAVINATNTSVIATASAGIFGLGFPVSSIVWNELYSASVQGSPPNQRRGFRALETEERLLPSIPLPSPPKTLVAADDATGVNITTRPDNLSSDILSSFVKYGSLVPRLTLNTPAGRQNTSVSYLAAPQISVTLQRTTPIADGNVGLFTLGGLPPGVKNESLTWAPVRLYSEAQNGVKVPEAPSESYPYAWEVFLEDVFFDGKSLPRSSLGDSDKVGLSALVDTGSSLIRGPPDIISTILARLTNSSTAPASVSDARYPCAEPHTLSFKIGGVRFDVDPRDFGSQVYNDDSGTLWCVPNLAPTDPPVLGQYLHSWSLGDPFLKGVLSSFYYGNITHPSADLPRIGFLSTVPDDAPVLLGDAVREAQRNGGAFPVTTISAPTGTLSGAAVSTNEDGVVQTARSNSETSNSSVRFSRTCSGLWWPWMFLWGAIGFRFGSGL